jgi:ketosteroid isomerase-like protein
VAGTVQRRGEDELGDWFYAEDARALPPEAEPIQGHAEIVEYFRQLRESGDVSFELGVIETVAEGSIGYLVGTYVFTSGGHQCERRDARGMRLQPDGSSKCVVDMWHNSEPA